MSRRFALVLASILQLLAAPALATPRIVAAENFYGDVARQIAGPQAEISSILSNPDQDPHLFEASPAVARALAGAAITVSNGVDYDPWMATLLSASPAPGRHQIVVAGLVGARVGDNPHLWYDPRTMKLFARAFTVALDAVQPQGKRTADAARDRFLASLARSTPVSPRSAAVSAAPW